MNTEHLKKLKPRKQTVDERIEEAYRRGLEDGRKRMQREIRDILGIESTYET